MKLETEEMGKIHMEASQHYTDLASKLSAFQKNLKTTRKPVSFVTSPKPFKDILDSKCNRNINGFLRLRNLIHFLIEQIDGFEPVGLKTKNQ